MYIRLATGVFLILLTQSLSAQMMVDTVIRLNQVEISSSEIFKKEDAGMKETKVDSMVLMQKINLSLSTVLAENTPVFIKDYGRGALATASFRGTAPSHTQVNWNGMSINTPMSGMVDFSLIPVYIIDEMSLKFGTASIADQSGGLGGSVNINNKIDWNETVGVKYVQGIGSYSTFDEFLQVQVGNQNVQSKTRLYHNHSKNDFTFINRSIANIDPETGRITNPVDTNHNADYTRYGILQELYFRPGSQNIISAKWWWQYADRTIPQATSYEGSNNSNHNNQKDVDNRIMLDWKHYGEKSRLILRSGYSDKQLDYSLENRVYGLGLIPAVYSESTQKSWMNRLDYHYDFREDFAISTTLDYNYHDVNTRDSVKQSGYTKNRNELSWLISAQKSFAGILNLNLMLRQDWVDFETVPVVPFLGFDLRVWKTRNLILKGNIARNYHQPTLNDLYWQPGGNPNLLPEEGFSFELGLEDEFDISCQNLHMEITAFRSDIDNWILWVPTFKGYWEPRNVNRVLSQGIEISLSLDGKIGAVDYRLSGNYAYTRALNYGEPLIWGDESYGKQLPYIPQHSGNLMANVNWNGFYLTWQHSSYSERYTTSSNDVSQRDRLYPYFMNDLLAGKSFNLGKVRMNGEIRIYNLFDETYHSVLYRPMPGRNFMFVLMVGI
jgi:iron complex outermembrane receptor protein